jgi:hypothetical protein
MEAIRMKLSELPSGSEFVGAFTFSQKTSPNEMLVIKVKAPDGKSYTHSLFLEKEV